jgi:hypothetical protein
MRWPHKAQEDASAVDRMLWSVLRSAGIRVNSKCRDTRALAARNTWVLRHSGSEHVHSQHGTPQCCGTVGQNTCTRSTEHLSAAAQWVRTRALAARNTWVLRHSGSERRASDRWLTLAPKCVYCLKKKGRINLLTFAKIIIDRIIIVQFNFFIGMMATENSLWQAHTNNDSNCHLVTTVTFYNAIEISWSYVRAG